MSWPRKTGNYICLTRWTIDLDALTDFKLGYFLFCFGGHCSSMLLAVMSIEKFIALYFPLKAKSYCTVGTAKWVTGILAFIIAGLSFPLFIFYTFDGNSCVKSNHSSLFEIIFTDSHCLYVSSKYCNYIQTDDDKI